MTGRQENLLKELIETYVSQAEPVSSAMLAKRVSVSSATVRNEFAELEQDGYLAQPHTSAGRVPTLKAYEHYVRHTMSEKALPSAAKAKLRGAVKEAEPAKALAKQAADIAQAAVLLAFSRDSHYYTGLSQLFSQPEFGDQRLILNMARILDVLETVMPQLHELASDDVVVLLGNRNPFGPQVSLFLATIPFQKKHDGVCAFLAPLRTDYGRNVTLLKQVQKLIAT